jgi:preprotein translocase subunit SecD
LPNIAIGVIILKTDLCRAMLRVSKLKVLLVVLISLFSIYLSLPTFFPQLKEHPWMTKDAVNLGLDLRGGAYILLEVDFSAYEREQIQRSVDQIRIKFKNNKIATENFLVAGNRISFDIASGQTQEEVRKEIFEALGTNIHLSRNDSHYAIEFDEQSSKAMRNDLMSQTIEIVRRRVDETGTREVDLQRQGDNYILLQVPGLDDPNEIKRLLGKTAKLSFHLVEDKANLMEAMQGKLAFGTKVLPLEGSGGKGPAFLVVQSRAMVTGEMLIDAQTAVNNGTPVVNFRFNNVGAKLFADVTTKNVSKPFAIVLDNKIISAPTIREPILGGSGQISGNFTVQSANELALLLRAGALPVPLKVAEERTVGPSLGLDSIASGTKAAAIGTMLVVLFMGLFYSLFGMFANIAMIINLFMIVSIMALMGATLTLPGIAGMVLTLGMAVDANVLIFERIREEMRKGRTPIAAIESGFSLAFATILDSNITTVLVAMILYIMGSGAVKGFAVTLTIGILCSMFTAITMTKLIVALWYRRNKPKYLPV